LISYAKFVRLRFALTGLIGMKAGLNCSRENPLRWRDA
jgi:hypothetical protein